MRKRSGPKRSKMSRSRKRFYKKYKSYRGMAYTAYKGVKLLKGLINVENHLFDSFNSTTYSTTATVQVLNDISSGDANQNRTGTSILAKHLTAKYSCYINASATASIVRCLIVRDLHNQNATPAATDILADVATYPTISPIKESNTDRFWVLSDKKYTLSINGSRLIEDEIYIPLDFHISFTSTGSGKYETNSIFLLIVSNEATNTPVVQWYTRLSFYDN